MSAEPSEMFALSSETSAAFSAISTPAQVISAAPVLPVAAVTVIHLSSGLSRHVDAKVSDLLNDAIFEKERPLVCLLQPDTAFSTHCSAKSQRLSDVNALVRRQQEVKFNGHRTSAASALPLCSVVDVLPLLPPSTDPTQPSRVCSTAPGHLKFSRQFVDIFETAAPAVVGRRPLLDTRASTALCTTEA